MHLAHPSPDRPPPRPKRRRGLRADLALTRDVALLPALSVVVFWIAYAIVTADARRGSSYFYCAGGLSPLVTVGEVYLGAALVGSVVLGRRRNPWLRVGLVLWNVVLTVFLLLVSFLMAWTGSFSGINCGA